ncbi:MAG: phosphotransferase [Azospirillum sp.]|nr:phosphotransferase [Azospirillum sp.]
MMPAEPGLAGAIAAATGSAVAATRPLAQGNTTWLTVHDLADGRRVVAKRGRPGARLDLEGWMLETLARRSCLPLPRVHLAEAALLVMDFVETSGGLDARSEIQAADLLAELHARPADRYGLERDTLIGPLGQANPRHDDWIVFFRDHRLLAMARRAFEERRLDLARMTRIEALAARLDEFIGVPGPPALIHGDLWSGNILVRDGTIAALIDPAIYCADPEIELAFTTLFGSFGDSFFRRYQEHRPLRPGFFEVRRDLYNLYPLLVHLRLFGASYLGGIDRTLRRLVG